MFKRKHGLSVEKHERSVIYSRLGMNLARVVLARGFRSLTSRLLLRAFSTPMVRWKPTASQQAILDRGERFTVRVAGGEAAGWRWGSGPAVLLVHGWEGRAAQLMAWVPELMRRGYSVIALDHPAHGASPGSSTNAIVMTKVLLALGDRTGPLAGVVAHSLGGLVASYALSQGLEVGSIVLVSTPSAPGPFFERLMGMARIPRSRRSHVMRGAEALLGDTFDRFATRSTWLGITTPVLVIHDRRDRQVAFDSVADHLHAIPHAVVHETDGLGHNRILADEGVRAAGVDFIDAFSAANFRRPLAPGFTKTMNASPFPGDELVSIEEVLADLVYGRC